jgi:hypothetical protein
MTFPVPCPFLDLSYGNGKGSTFDIAETKNGRQTVTLQVEWARRFILFHGKRHPADFGAAHVTSFLTHLAVEGDVSRSGRRDRRSPTSELGIPTEVACPALLLAIVMHWSSVTF